jgi:hypothetical protein
MNGWVLAPSHQWHQNDLAVGLDGCEPRLFENFAVNGQRHAPLNLGGEAGVVPCQRIQNLFEGRAFNFHMGFTVSGGTQAAPDLDLDQGLPLGPLDGFQHPRR